jgi:hypothetical protein
LSGLVTLTVRPPISSSTNGEAMGVFHLFARGVAARTARKGGYPAPLGEVAEWLKAAPC